MELILTIVHVLMVLLAQTVKQTLMNAFLILVKMEERVAIGLINDYNCACKLMYSGRNCSGEFGTSLAL